MTPYLSDRVISRLQQMLDAPDFTGTRYCLLEELDRGGMGVVYRAEDTQLQREVALKVLRLSESGNAERMLKEAQIIARLEHPGIVPVHDAGTLADGRFFYAMKLVRGKRVDDYAAGMGLAPLLRIFERACEAVAFAHAQGVVHRDLKPANIMIGEFGEVLIMDWGVAKVLTQDAREDAGGAAPGTVVGTPPYMSPEQARGEAGIDARTDIFSLGALLRFLISETAQKPPRALAAVCEKAMAASPAGRYASAGELGADVARYLSRERVLAYREPLWERTARLASRHRVLILLLLAYAVMRTMLFFFLRR